MNNVESKTKAAPPKSCKTGRQLWPLNAAGPWVNFRDWKRSPCLRSALAAAVQQDHALRPGPWAEPGKVTFTEWQPRRPAGTKTAFPSQFALQAVVGWGKTSPIRLQIDSMYQPELLGLGVRKTGVWCGTINLNFGDITSKQQKGMSNLTIATHIHKPLLWKQFPIQSFFLNASPTSVQLTWKRVLALVLNSSKRNCWAARDGLELPIPRKASGGQALPKTTTPAACSESGGFSLPWSTPSRFRAACDYSNLCTRKKTPTSK